MGSTIVFVNLDRQEYVQSFSRSESSVFEWANILYASASYFRDECGDVYLRLEKDLPLKACYVNSMEVDCLADLEKMSAFVKSLQ